MSDTDVEEMIAEAVQKAIEAGWNIDEFYYEVHEQWESFYGQQIGLGGLGK